MAAPSSKSTICQLALDLLQEDNQAPVVNIDEPETSIEETFGRWYDAARRALLRKKPWNFAKKRIQLNASGVTPAFGYEQQYALPNDFIRYLTTESEAIFSNNMLTNYTIEGNNILTSGDATSVLNLRYVYDFTNVTLMDPIFIILFAIDLAGLVSYKFTVSNSNVERLNSLRTQKMTEAAAISGQEDPPKRIERSRALAARRRLGNNFNSGRLYPC